MQTMRLMSINGPAEVSVHLHGPAVSSRLNHNLKFQFSQLHYLSRCNRQRWCIQCLRRLQYGAGHYHQMCLSTSVPRSKLESRGHHRRRLHQAEEQEQLQQDLCPWPLHLRQQRHRLQNPSRSTQTI